MDMKKLGKLKVLVDEHNKDHPEEITMKVENEFCAIVRSEYGFIGSVFMRNLFKITDDVVISTYRDGTLRLRVYLYNERS